jgi:hybrid cluster-associated redox disulfide protein
MAKVKKIISKNKPIGPDMPLGEVISRYPETMEVFLKHGFHCFGCMGVGFEDLRAAAKAHGVKPADLLKDLNRAVKKRKTKSRK